MRPCRSVILLLLAALQCWVGAYRGQAILLEVRHGQSHLNVAIARSLALHGMGSREAHGSHDHDELPLHLHVPEEETASRKAKALTEALTEALPADAPPLGMAATASRPTDLPESRHWPPGPSGAPETGPLAAQGLRTIRLRT
jgi:hypothetical protein